MHWSVLSENKLPIFRPFLTKNIFYTTLPAALYESENICETIYQYTMA